MKELKTVNKEKNKGCGCLIAVAIIAVAFCVFVAILSAVYGDGGSASNSSIIKRELELTDEEASTMLQVFEDCGIGEITSVQLFQSGDDRTSYHMEDEETAMYGGVSGTIVVWVDNESKAVQEIYFNDNDIYLDGEVIAPITNYYVSSEDREKYRTASQIAVKQILNYPDTAEFKSISGWKFGIEGNTVIVQSSVSAKNAFGMESTSDFQVKFENGSITSLVVEGTEYVK